MTCHVIKTNPDTIYPVRKPRHSCLSVGRYAGDGENTCKSRSTNSLLRAGSKPSPFKRDLLFYLGDLRTLQTDAPHQSLLIEEKRIDF